VKRGKPLQEQLLAMSACWLICTSHGEYRTARISEELGGGGGTDRNFLFNSESSYVNLHFPLLIILSIDGNSVAQSWHPSAMNGPAAKFNNFFFRTVVGKLDVRSVVYK
jgi:hypothetical protein